MGWGHRRNVNLAVTPSPVTPVTPGRSPVALSLTLICSPPSSCRECAVGFSAVLFALKVVLNAGSPDTSVVYGVTVPTKVCVEYRV